MKEKHSGLTHALSIKTLLLERHRALLIMQFATNITGRLLSFGLIVLVAFSNAFSPELYAGKYPETWLSKPRLSMFLLLSFAGVVIGFFWGYLARTNEEQLNRLEEIIVQGNDISRDQQQQSEKQDPWPQNDSDSQEDSREVDRWRQIYIEWKHESWKHPNRERLLRLEPFVWFVLLLAFLIVKLVLGATVLISTPSPISSQ